MMATPHSSARSSVDDARSGDCAVTPADPPKQNSATFRMAALAVFQGGLGRRMSELKARRAAEAERKYDEWRKRKQRLKQLVLSDMTGNVNGRWSSPPPASRRNDKKKRKTRKKPPQRMLEHPATTAGVSAPPRRSVSPFVREQPASSSSSTDASTTTTTTATSSSSATPPPFRSFSTDDAAGEPYARLRRRSPCLFGRSLRPLFAYSYSARAPPFFFSFSSSSLQS